MIPTIIAYMSFFIFVIGAAMYIFSLAPFLGLIFCIGAIALALIAVIIEHFFYSGGDLDDDI